MTGDDVCPRCDSPLNTAGEDETILPVDRSLLPTTELPEVEAAPAPLGDITAEDPLDETAPDDTAGLVPTASLSEAVIDRGDEDTAEQPTAEYIPAAETAYNLPKYVVPPAPYTPPPVRAPIPDPAWITPPPAPVYAPPPTYGYAAPPVDRLQQRVQVYQHGGYHLKNRTPHAATLTHGKVLGVTGWLLAFLTIIGALWYFLLALLGGFRADRVYITREADGSLFEDGAGAAHIRLKRARIGRRWAIFGSMIFVVCLVLAILLGIAGGIITSQERYQAALREAYPAVTLFEEQFSHSEADPDDVALVKDGAVAYAILAGIAGVGVWGGATLFVIGTIHAGAYRVSVPPLPGMEY